MFSRLCVTLLIGSLLLASPLQADDEPKPVQVSDLLKIEQLGDVTVSPDGRHVAYTAQRIVETGDEEQPYDYRTHLHVVRADGNRPPRQLTRGEHSISQPTWHPDGDRISFVRSVDGPPQVYTLSLSGGEPIQVTDAEYGAVSPSWSPRGEQLLYAASLPGAAVAELTGQEHPAWPDERPGRERGDTELEVPDDTLVVFRDSLTEAALDTLAFEDVTPDTLGVLSDSLRAFPDTVSVEATPDMATEPDPDGNLLQVRRWLDDQQDADDPRVFNRLDLQHERDLRPRLTHTHYFVVDVEDDEAVGAPQLVTAGFYSFGGGEWHPNGDQIFVTGAPTDEEHPDRVQESGLYISDVDTAEVRSFLEIEDYGVFNPQVAPDGTTIAFQASDLTDPGYAETQIGLYPIDGRSAPELITEDFDRSASRLTWSPDSWYLYFTANSDGGTPLYRMNPLDREEGEGAPDAEPEDGVYTMDETMVRTPPIERLTSYERGVQSYDVTTATAYYVMTEVSNPYELYTNNLDFIDERRLTEHNASWLDDRRLSEPDAFTVESDTFDIDGWVMRPTEFEEGEEYPLLLQIHGGPAAMWGPGEPTMWHEFQYFASRGYGVVYSNPRGSGGYGHDFRSANYQDWGTGPMNDVLAAAEYAADLEWTDPDRQVVTGGSYAGYLTAWIISQDDRFEAAVAQRGVYDLPTFLGEGRAWRLVPNHFGGYPWEGEVPPPIGTPDTLRADHPADTLETDTTVVRSPGELSPRELLIRNSPTTYVDQIDTPLLLLHADDDLRTGVIQSEMLYKWLKIREQPVEYVRYPDAGHDLSRSGDPRQRIDRMLRIYEFMERYLERDDIPNELMPAGGG